MKKIKIIIICLCIFYLFGCGKINDNTNIDKIPEQKQKEIIIDNNLEEEDIVNNNNIKAEKEETGSNNPSNIIDNNLCTQEGVESNPRTETPEIMREYYCPEELGYKDFNETQCKKDAVCTPIYEKEKVIKCPKNT